MALLAYYRRLLPFRSLYTWLNHDVAVTRNFVNREFAFTLQNDAYLRYQSFSSWDDWKKEVCRLNPSRFEIGPVYSAKVRAAVASANLPSQRTERRCKKPLSAQLRARLSLISI